MELPSSQNVNICAGSFHNMEPWLILVHTVDNQL